MDQLGTGRCAESWLTPGLKEYNPIFLNNVIPLGWIKTDNSEGRSLLKPVGGRKDREIDRTVAQRKQNTHKSLEKEKPNDWKVSDTQKKVQLFKK